MISIFRIKTSQYVFPPNQATGRQLLDDHRIVHAWWTTVTKKHRKIKQRKTGKILGKKEIIDLHTQIVEEMLKRGYKHHYRSSLDDTLPKHLKDKTIQ